MVLALASLAFVLLFSAFLNFRSAVVSISDGESLISTIVGSLLFVIYGSVLSGVAFIMLVDVVTKITSS